MSMWRLSCLYWILQNYGINENTTVWSQIYMYFTSKEISFTGWAKCSVWLGIEPGTPCLQGKCSTNWAICLPDKLSPLWWLSLYCDRNARHFTLKTFHYQDTSHQDTSNQFINFEDTLHQYFFPDISWKNNMVTHILFIFNILYIN